MGRILNTILDKVSSKKAKGGIEGGIFRIHHTLMKEYGWIPLEEFKTLPQQTVNNLLHEINVDRKAENKANKKGLRRGKRGK